MPNIVGVQFKKQGKIYYFDPKDIKFELGDGAVVETTHGLEYGTVALANCDVDSSEIKGELKPVTRKATEEDEEQHRSIVEKRPLAIRDAQERANKHKLDMKIVDAEFAFDNSKVVFFFTSENRVDFRDLVKDLAATFRMRIELRQIGIRDECKMKGGFGPCGRVCCCNAYLSDFERVSIKMAKNQGLSLNPQKISGLCGRLMCCLKFENDYYVQTAKFLPKVGSEISTPSGNGKVVDTDMLRCLVTVKIVKNEDESELRTYTAEELGITPVYACECEHCAEDDGEQDSDAETDEGENK